VGATIADYSCFQGCCLSSPADDDGPPAAGQNAPAQTRHTPQTITSQTAINGADDPRSRSLAPPSGLSIHPSETSRSVLSTPRGSAQDVESRPPRQASLADHFNLPLKPPKPWKSKNKTWTRSQLLRERYEFFETRVTGRKEIWNGLKQVIECMREGDLADAQGILDAMSVTLPTGHLEEGSYDEYGNLYRIPQAVISDPTDVVEDMNDAETDTVTGSGDIDAIAAKLDAAENANLSESKQDLVQEKARAAKGKTAIRDAVKVRCRLSDRGSPECDVTVILDRSEKVAQLPTRIQLERDVSWNELAQFYTHSTTTANASQIPSKASLRFAYLGKILDKSQTLEEQGWKEGNVIQVLVTGDWK
jgi:hypothetical protein